MCKMGTNNIEKRKREQEMMKLKRTGLGLLLLAGLLCLQTGCSASGTGQNEEKIGMKRETTRIRKNQILLLKNMSGIPHRAAERR